MIDPSLQNPNFHFVQPSQPSHSSGSFQPTYPGIAMANQPPVEPPNQSAQQMQQSQHRPRKTPEPESSGSSEQSSPERSLPNRDVSEDNIDSAYAEFILYCNPSIPQDVQTEELKKGFRNPPRSDGNTFSPWTLFNLLQRLEKKEIKTWAHLVIELGVEPPDREKNQSAQKVQQYAVRLKRWLHAYHIDSFFNYLSSRPSTYYTERPMTDTDLAETVREGVPPEEDLAVRALLPEWRPKRGRRKADDAPGFETPTDNANLEGQRPSGRASSAEYGTIFENHYSGTPSSAVTWNTSHNVSQDDVWTAAKIAIVPKTASPRQQHQVQSAHPNNARQMMWRFPHSNANDTGTPSSAYPQSAVTNQNPMSATAFGENEPKSAIPVSATVGSKSPGSTRRKRHAPAISSAWNQGPSGGKIRGRPPSNRNIQDGPFGTFPVNPSPKDAGTLQNVTSSGVSTIPRQPSPSRTSMSPPTFGVEPTSMSAPTIQTTNASSPSRSRSSSAQEGSKSSALRKPSKLQLQVPHQPGGLVRLATPPRLFGNGETQIQAAATQSRQSSGESFNMQLNGISESDDMAMLEPHAEEEREIDWKRRCYVLMRKLQEKEEELKRVKRAVLDAVM